MCKLLPTIIFNIIKQVWSKTRSRFKSQKRIIKEQRLELEKYTAVSNAPKGNYRILIETQQAICPVCWGMHGKPIPIFDNGTGYYVCGNCGASEIYDRDVAGEQDGDSMYRQYIDYN